MVLYQSSINGKEARVMSMVTFYNSNHTYLLFQYRAPENSYDKYLSEIGNIVKSVQQDNGKPNMITENLQTPAIDHKSVLGHLPKSL